jgi:glycerol-3-phosphate acyltransferase PlsY
MLVQIIAGVAAVIGHIWTIMAKFKGGKGVATGGGMIIALFPWAALICFFIFITIVLLTRYVSVGSMAATSALPLALIIMDRVFGITVPPAGYIFSILVALLIFYTHRANIRRLINGTENRFNKIQLRRKF